MFNAVLAVLRYAPQWYVSFSCQRICLGIADGQRTEH